jgi:predicted transcriptional regulator
MYRSNLSWTVMQGFIKSLEEQGLITADEHERKKRYLLTEKGERVLATYRSVRTQLESIEALATV